MTGWLLENDSPRSPWTRFPIQRTYCTRTGWSRPNCARIRSMVSCRTFGSSARCVTKSPWDELRDQKRQQRRSDERRDQVEEPTDDVREHARPPRSLSWKIGASAARLAAVRREHENGAVATGGGGPTSWAWVRESTPRRKVTSAERRSVLVVSACASGRASGRSCGALRPAHDSRGNSPSDAGWSTACGGAGSPCRGARQLGLEHLDLDADLAGRVVSSVRRPCFMSCSMSVSCGVRHSPLVLYMCRKPSQL
jgi:hypothetical protein